MLIKNLKILLYIPFLIFLMLFLYSGEDRKISFIPEIPVSEFTLDLPEVKLPWPQQTPGMTESDIEELIKNLWIIDNFGTYHESDDGQYLYFHDGFDIVVPNGTKIHAVESGYVKYLTEEYEWMSMGNTSGDSPGWGWMYGHVNNFQVEVGDYVNQGDYIGDVSFEGVPHIHFSRIYLPEGDWSNALNYLSLHPDKYFDYIDTIPPEILTPFYYFKNNSNDLFEYGNPPILRGEVDIAVPIRDLSECVFHESIRQRWCVAKIDYEISGELRLPVYRKSFDFTKFILLHIIKDNKVNIIYKSRYLPVLSRKSIDDNYSFYIITNTDGSRKNEIIKDEWKDFSWNTLALDQYGNRLFPDGVYTITVTAYDFKGNSTSASDTVEVKNHKKGKSIR